MLSAASDHRCGRSRPMDAGWGWQLLRPPRRGVNRFACIDPTLGIATWGAVTGTVATVGGIVALLRDRPRLVASQHIEVTPGQVEAERKGQLVLLVINEGRQPVTVRGAGFGLDFSVKTGRWPFRQRAPFAIHAETRDQAKFPLRLDAGAPLELRIDAKAVTINPELIPRGLPKTLGEESARRSRPSRSKLLKMRRGLDRGRSGASRPSLSTRARKSVQGASRVGCGS